MLSDLIARCPHCGKLFRGPRSTLSLQEHVDNIHAPHHTSTPALQQSSSPSSSPCLVTPNAVNSDADRPYVCVKCKASFMHKDHLEKHEHLHSTQGQSCQLCNKSFANVYRLQRHMLSHDESQVLRKFKCPECFKAFKFKHHLKEHIRIHSGEKPFACPNCGKRFSHSGSYSSHMTSKKCLVVNLKVRKTDHVRSQRSRNTASHHNGSQILTSQSSLANVDSLVNNVSQNHSNNSLRSSLNQYNKEEGFNISHNNSMSAVKSESGNYPIFSLSSEFQHCNSDHSFGNYLPSSGFSSGLSNLSPALLSAAAASVGLQPHYLPAALANYPDMAHALLRSQMEKTGKDIEVSKEKFSNGCAKLDACKHLDSKSLSKSLLDSYDLNSMRKFLQIVDATVASKSHESPSNGSITDIRTSNISPLALCASALHLPQIAPIDSPDENKKLYFGAKCRFCSEYFDNKIDLHHHESYLCKSNQNTPKPSGEVIRDAYGTDFYSKSQLSSLNIAESDEESQRDSSSLDDEVMMADGKKVRVRSVLSEETLRVLRAQYEINPRPKKHDILRLSEEVNYPPRVVQVWFQNMRARDRRLGRPIPSVQTSNELNLIESHYQRGSHRVLSPLHHPTSQHSIPPLMPITIPHFKPTAQFSHAFSPTIVSSPYNGIALYGHRNINHQSHLSTEFSPPLALKNDSCKKSLNHDSENQSLHSGHSDEPLDLSLRNKIALSDVNHNISSSPSDFEVLNLSQRSSRSLSEMDSDDNKLLSVNISLAVIQQQQRQELEQTSIVRSMLMNKCRPQELDTPINRFNSFPVINGAMQSPDQIGRCSPIVNEESKEVKRELFLKRPHSACEDVGQNSDNTNPSDEFNSADSQSRSKQVIDSPSKLWRGNVDNNVINRDDHTPPDANLQGDGTGLYTCDQCDKTFSKQSSLARHKYEHSGQRPHKCDVCNKAFKHKHHLTEHKRLHSGEKPFQCKKCLKRFSHSGSYSQHMNHRYSYCKPYRE